ncbi:MAG: lipid-binding SYLF domain-containing protein [Pseudomonadales bacterium]
MLRFLLLIVSVSISSSVMADKYEGTLLIFESNMALTPYFKGSYGYVVFPTVGKAAFGVGGAFGKGKVYKKHKVTGRVSLAKVSFGFQIGGQAFSEIIFLEDERAFEEFTTGRFEFDLSASAVAITAGAQARIGTTGSTFNASAGPATAIQVETGYSKGMAIFTHTIGGLMYEAAIGGQKFKYRPNEPAT